MVRSSRLALIPLALMTLACGTLSVQEEKDLGRQVQRQVREQATFVRDPVTVTYVRDMGDDLVDAAPPSPFDFRFFVIEDESLNAFAVPGGAIYIHTGLITAVKDAAELAGVLAHEIGHVTARHVAKMAKRGRNTGVAAQVVALLIAILTGNPYLTDAGTIASGVAAQAYMSTYTKDAEREADEQAIDTMIGARWDPHALVTMFQTLQQESKGGAQMPEFLASHPATQDRIDTVNASISRRGQGTGLRRDDGGRLEIIQKRLDLIVGMDIEEMREDDEDE